MSVCGGVWSSPTRLLMGSKYMYSIISKHIMYTANSFFSYTSSSFLSDTKHVNLKSEMTKPIFVCLHYMYMYDQTPHQCHRKSFFSVFQIPSMHEERDEAAWLTRECRNTLFRTCRGCFVDDKVKLLCE